MRRGIVGSRARAVDAVLAGRVLVSGAVATKPERLVAASEPIHVTRDRPRFVSRGGEKLDAALDAFGVAHSGSRCLDVGSSTGGFTDRLLQGGARCVVALDVGRGQLDHSLRTDDSVIVMERTDVRNVSPDDVGVVDLVVVDVSFISLRTVLPAIVRLASSAPIVALVKPQFEVGRGRVGKGGVVRDAELHREAVESVIAAAAELGWRCEAELPSPITGAQGNREFFILLRRSGEARP